MWQCLAAVQLLEGGAEELAGFVMSVVGAAADFSPVGQVQEQGPAQPQPGADTPAPSSSSSGSSAAACTTMHSTNPRDDTGGAPHPHTGSSSGADGGRLSSSSSSISPEAGSLSQLLGLAPEDLVLHVCLLGVLPAYRRAGLASTLFTQVINSARTARASAIFLYVLDSNAPALAFYQQLGFKQCARLPSYYRLPSHDSTPPTLAAGVAPAAPPVAHPLVDPDHSSSSNSSTSTGSSSDSGGGDDTAPRRWADALLLSLSMASLGAAAAAQTSSFVAASVSGAKPRTATSSRPTIGSDSGNQRVPPPAGTVAAPKMRGLMPGAGAGRKRVDAVKTPEFWKSSSGDDEGRKQAADGVKPAQQSSATSVTAAGFATAAVGTAFTRMLPAWLRPKATDTSADAPDATQTVDEGVPPLRGLQEKQSYGARDIQQHCYPCRPDDRRTRIHVGAGRHARLVSQSFVPSTAVVCRPLGRVFKL
ncbi:hypothetical protein V8C86DRAFT_566534 [Haematococcus lacustris]